MENAFVTAVKEGMSVHAYAPTISYHYFIASGFAAILKKEDLTSARRNIETNIRYGVR